MGRATAAVALAFGLVGGAYAQAQPAVSGTGTSTNLDNTSVGGTTSDMTSAGNANGTGMPQIQHQGDIAYVSGGVGSDESNALKRAAPQWPLSMRFTGRGSDYIADVHVRIDGSDNTPVLQADARGPYMLVKLPPGRYTVHARYNGEDQTRQVTIPTSGDTRADFEWSAG
jgi:hypothetical protein